ncbi:GNAT family N-acetyltransferase [Tropicimonas sp. IMCC34043]|uniref:GNAT family N-acetyltransferase n=1 Tax=Tropicimonas sp. IMCC34043 TaxID=2248760 RepID=UPI001E4F6196|nr:GNAT family N-acetyltransferase [Tropicimonas sp. IMCC34043]
MNLPRRLGPDDADMEAVHVLLVESFADMEGQIDPPSSLTRMGVDDLRVLAAEGPAWVIGAPPVGCVFTRVQGDNLYLQKLAVAPAARGRGVARRLIDTAADHARAEGLQALQLKTRIELVKNHAAFIRLGFSCIGWSAHPGYEHATSLTFARLVDDPEQDG